MAGSFPGLPNSLRSVCILQGMSTNDPFDENAPPPVPPAESRTTLRILPELLDDLTAECVRTDEPNVIRRKPRSES